MELTVVFTFINRVDRDVAYFLRNSTGLLGSKVTVLVSVIYTVERQLAPVTSK